MRLSANTNQLHLLFPGIPRHRHCEPSWAATQRLWRSTCEGLLMSGLEKVPDLLPTVKSQGIGYPDHEMS